METKLNYNGNNFRIRLNHSVNSAKSPEVDPQEFIEKTRKKLSQLEENGEIETFYIFKNQFLTYWKLLKGLPSSDRPLVFDLGFGARFIDIELSEGTAQALATVSKIQPYQGGIRFEELLVNVLKSLEPSGLDELVSQNSLRSLYFRWSKKILKTPFPLLQKKRLDHQSVDIATTINRKLGEAYLYVGHSSFFQDKESLKVLFGRAKKVFQKVQKNLPTTVFLEKDFIAEITEEVYKLGSLGIDLPRVFLLAVDGGADLATKAPRLRPKAQASGQKAATNQAKNSLLKIKFSENNLEARIVGVAEKLKSAEIKLQKDQLIAELHKWGIRFGFESFLDEFLMAIDLNHDLKGRTIAVGRDPEPGTKAFLYEIYKNTGLTEKDQNVDLDMDQINRHVVEEGQVIAELRYEDGQMGCDVFGNQIYPINSDPGNSVKLGENVVINDEGRFVSTIHGMPIVKNNTIQVSQIFIHNGDLNRSSGNVKFDGSAEIKGNVESGAVISVTENLTVTGTVGVCTINCGGNLIVQGGIVTTDSGLIQVKGKLSANFVENSKIIVTGDMFVKKSVLNSTVVVGGILKLASKKSIVGGGMISVKNRLITSNLGFTDGKRTICRIGTDWKIERRTAIREGRCQRLNVIEEIESKNLHEARAKEQRKLARKGRSADEIKKRVDKIGLLRRKLERSIKNLQSQLNWNRNGIIIVDELLSANVDLTVGGQGVLILEDVKEVIVTYHKIRGTRVNPIRALMEFEERVLKGESS